MKSSNRLLIITCVLFGAIWVSFTTLTRAQTASSSSSQTQNSENSFVGSESCAVCHNNIYERWRETLMANILVDPAQNPGVILGDFSTPNSLVTFSLEDIAFTYGSKWKQRYFTRIGDDFFVQPAQWDVLNREWRPYRVAQGTDWWVEHYPEDQMQRPTGALCDGCHSTNYNIETKQVTEWNVGCEKCHGPGGDHEIDPTALNIVNPARLDTVAAVDVCLQCHSQGQPLEKPLNGVYYDWPVGYLPGDNLSEFWMMEEHHLGEDTFTHWPGKSVV